MADIAMKDLLEAGVHFGHQTRRWNPKMKKFIFMERNGIYIIDLQKTLKCAQEAKAVIEKVVRGGGHVLFVGTKKQAKPIVVEEATRCGQFYVTERWLGGMLTNFKTIRTSIKRLNELDRMATRRHVREAHQEGGLAPRRASARACEFAFSGIKEMPGAAVAGLRGRHEEGEDRGRRGEPPRHPDRRRRRHQLRSRPHRTTRSRATTTRSAPSACSRAWSRTPSSRTRAAVALEGADQETVSFGGEEAEGEAQTASPR